MSKSDEARQEDDDELEMITDGMCENFVVLLREMQKFCSTEEEFLATAAVLICEDVNARAEQLSALFDDSEAFPAITIRRTAKRVSKYASSALSDDDIPGCIGDYYTGLLAQDMDAVRHFMKEVYRDQDLRDLKIYMARVCELLEELSKTSKKKRIRKKR